MEPAHTTFMPQAIRTIFRSIQNSPQMIALKRQRNDPHTPEIHTGMHLYQQNVIIHLK